MKICLIAEGCYPYVVGGVSSWLHRLIQSFPSQEFVILTIVANRSWSGKYVYDLPENVTEVHELYLEDYDWSPKGGRAKSLGKKEYRALRSLLLNQKVDWESLFDLFQKKTLSVDKLLMSVDFLNAVTDCYNLRYSQIVFSDFLWMLRSIYLPLFHTLKMQIPKADLYHCTATGNAGVLGSEEISPAACLPRLMSALRDGWLLEENREDWNETPCLRLSVDQSGLQDGKIVSTVWLRQEDGTPLRGEIAVDGEIILTADFTSFAFCDTMESTEENGAA